MAIKSNNAIALVWLVFSSALKGGLLLFYQIETSRVLVLVQLAYQVDYS